MGDTTVEGLPDIHLDGGVGAADLFYGFRPGVPDKDYKVSGAELITFVESQISGFQSENNRLDDISANLSAASGTVEKTGVDTFGTYTVTSAAKALLDDVDTAAMRSTLGVVIGSNVQAYDPELAALAGLASAADKIPYFTGAGTAGLTTFNAAARDLCGLISLAKGDVVVYNGGNFVRLGVGADAQVLTADSSQAAGVKWAGIAGDSSDVIWFGDGSDGTVSISSGTVTLTRDMYYANLTISGTGILNTAGYRIFVSGTLDLSAAPAGAIRNNGATGGSASGTTGGTGGGATAGNILGNGMNGGTGGNGGTGSGTTGAASSLGKRGGVGGTGAAGSGAGGSGSSGAGGGSGGSGSAVFDVAIRRASVDLSAPATAGGTYQPLSGGGGGAGGGGGGGDGTAGGGGGAGGSGGGVIGLWARTINRGSSTATSAVQALGGSGGAGGVPAGGNRGSGGGGAGGGGGWVYILYRFLTGSAATGLIDVSGGTGGAAGGSATGTGLGGHGGQGGAGGRVTLINIGAVTVSETAGGSGTAGGANSGLSGGTGGAGNAMQVTL